MLKQPLARGFTKERGRRSRATCMPPSNNAKKEYLCEMEEEIYYLWKLDGPTRNIVIDSFLRTWTNQSLDPDKCVVEEIGGGFHSRIFRVTYFDFGEHNYCVKVPTTDNITSESNAADALERIAYELEKSIRVSISPFTHTFGDVLICCGWPVFKSSWRNGTLRSLINDRVPADDFDKIFSVLQVVLALRYAKALGISPHQDLKPENIFYERIDDGKFPDYHGEGMRIHCRLADFALANAFRELGHPYGSRPYQAPEQYSEGGIRNDCSEKVDVFALGIILYELATGGLHLRGERTEDIWPEDERKPLSRRSTYKRSSNWKKWAQSEKNISSSTLGRFEGLRDLIATSVRADPFERPTLTEFEDLISRFLKSSWPERFNIAAQQTKDLQQMSQPAISAAIGANAGFDHLIKHVKMMRGAAVHLRSN